MLNAKLSAGIDTAASAAVICIMQFAFPPPGGTSISP